MSLTSNGLEFPDNAIKEILGDKELRILFLQETLNQLQKQLELGFDMKLTKLPDGNYKLEPEGKELEILQWVESRLGSTFLKDRIQEILDQRAAQRDWDDLNEIQSHFKSLSPIERQEFKDSVKAKADKKLK